MPWRKDDAAELKRALRDGEGEQVIPGRELVPGGIFFHVKETEFQPMQ